MTTTTRNNVYRSGLSGTSAFSLLEVLITIGILATIVLFASQLLKSGFDTRFALSEQAKLVHRANLIMRQVDYDLTHAYLISDRDRERSPKQRTIFKIDKSGSDKLFFTYMGHRSVFTGGKEGDQAYVVYEIQESKKYPGRTNLYRGESTRIPESFKENPEMKLLAKDVESIKFEPWAGDRWWRSRWDSSSGETKNRLPQMVRVVVKLWVDEPLGEGGEIQEEAESFEEYRSVSYLPYALDFNELKQPTTSFRLLK